MLRAVFGKGPWVLLINAGYKKSRRLLPAGFLAWGIACPPYGKGKNSSPRFPLFLRLPCLSPGLNLKNRKSPLSSRRCGLSLISVDYDVAERVGANCITQYVEMIGLNIHGKSCRTTGILYLDILAIQGFCVLWIRPAQLGRSVRF